MQREKGLVSIITPVYKTGKLLQETIESVLSQQYRNFELLLIDDGSKDDTISLLPDYGDERIRIIIQENQGMARTRNNGLKLARGEYVLFLDHDDLLEKDFLSERVKLLESDSEIGFVGGIVHTFPENPREYLSAAVDIEEEVLFFKPDFLTTPSSYLIRRSVLDDNNIGFNEALSSTADRFMLLKLNKVTKGARVAAGKLLYRISPGGFSQIIKPALVDDNESMYLQMVNEGLVPAKDRSRFKTLYFIMLAGGYRKVHNSMKSAKYLLKAFFANPYIFFKRLILKKTD